jgi:hypothetical protein
MPLGQPFLQMFNLWTQHLNNPAAFKANQMVMVLMLVFMLETLDAISEISLSCQAGVAYDSHCPVHSSKTNPWMFLSDKLIKVGNRWMFLHLQEYVEDFLSLFAVEHTLVFQVLPEDRLC